MAEKKYADLVKKLTFRGSFAPSRANATQLTFMTGEQLAGFDINFILGVYENPGNWTPERGSHTHPFAEYLLFFGYDEEDLNYFGAELELFMGEEWEAHKITTPTVALAPENFPHCPLITEKVYRPFGHLHLAMSANYAGGPGPEEPDQVLTDGTKYNYLFKELKAEKGPGGADAAEYLTFSGADRKDFQINFTMGLYNQPGKWNETKHTHPYDEILLFFGTRTEDLSYLGAEITIELGAEKHTFDVPTVVCIPKGLPHFPVTCHKVEKPYRMARIGLAPHYQINPV